MNGFLELKRTVGPGENDDEDDVIATKQALQQSGDYASPGGRVSRWRDSETVEGLKKVQRRNGLWPDGTMRPGGPTHRIINAEKKEREDRLKPNGLGLIATVGDGGSNQGDDVRRVRGALGQLGYLPESEAQRPGNIFDPATASGMRRFQLDYNQKTDGLALVSGPTDILLARASGPLRTIGQDSERPVKKRAATTTLLGAGGPVSPSQKTATPPLPPARPASPASAGSAFNSAKQTATATPKELTTFDLSFIHKQEDTKDYMYVPANKNGQVIGKSGPTIGSGYDLGQQDLAEFDRFARRHNLDPQLAARLRPYVGRKGQAALAYVQANPLKISSQEVEILSNAKYLDIYNTVRRRFDKAQESRGSHYSFDLLPRDMKTVVMSTAVNYGPYLGRSGHQAEDFWQAAVSGDRAAMVAALRDKNKMTSSDERRTREADYIDTRSTP